MHFRTPCMPGWSCSGSLFPEMKCKRKIYFAAAMKAKRKALEVYKERNTNLDGRWRCQWSNPRYCRRRCKWPTCPSVAPPLPHSLPLKSVAPSESNVSNHDNVHVVAYLTPVQTQLRGFYRDREHLDQLRDVLCELARLEDSGGRVCYSGERLGGLFADADDGHPCDLSVRSCNLWCGHFSLH